MLGSGTAFSCLPPSFSWIVSPTVEVKMSTPDVPRSPVPLHFRKKHSLFPWVEKLSRLLAILFQRRADISQDAPWLSTGDSARWTANQII